MEACIMICRKNKSTDRKNKVLFINAVHEVTRERAQSFLDLEHIQKITETYYKFEPMDGFSYVASNKEILGNDCSLSIPLYVNTGKSIDSIAAEAALEEGVDAWQQSGIALKQSLDALLDMFSNTPPDDPGDEPESEDESVIENEIKQNELPEKQVPPPAYLRSLLAAEIIYQNYQEARFGSVKLEKMIYLCDAHFGLGDMIDQHYLRQAAGPYDPKGMRSIRDNLLRHKWFTVKKVDNRATKYLPMEKCGEHQEAYTRYFNQQQQQIQILLDCMKSWKTKQCEIVATLYSAWADFLSEGTTPRDEQIINEVLVNWNESKLKIPVEKWRDGLKWMKQNGLYPGGDFGKGTI